MLTQGDRSRSRLSSSATPLAAWARDRVGARVWVLVRIRMRVRVRVRVRVGVRVRVRVGVRARRLDDGVHQGGEGAAQRG